MPENEVSSFMGFRSSLVWSAGDVVSLFTSVSGLYNTFLALHIRDEQESFYREAMDRYWREYVMLYERYIEGPLDKELLFMYRRLLRDWMKRGFKYPPPVPLPFGFPTTGILPQALSAWEIYESIDQYAVESDMLQVDRIRMSSPSGFSFKGLDGVAKEFREFVKDIWYRNKQEKAQGRLRLIEQYLNMRRKFPDADLPPLPTAPTERKLIKTVNEHIEKLDGLEQQGKLLDVAEHIDYRPRSSKEG